MAAHDGTLMETFVLRLFRPDPETDQELHGSLEHVASGVKVTFHTTAEMLAAITHQTRTELPIRVPRPSTERV